MFRAVWNGAVLAGSSHTVKAEGNHLFPAAPARGRARPGTTTSAWTAKVNHDAAWYYPQPNPAASSIAGHVAFWHGVRVERVPGPGEEMPAARAAAWPAAFSPGCTG